MIIYFLGNFISLFKFQWTHNSFTLLNTHTRLHQHNSTELRAEQWITEEKKKATTHREKYRRLFRSFDYIYTCAQCTDNSGSIRCCFTFIHFILIRSPFIKPILFSIRFGIFSLYRLILWLYLYLRWERIVVFFQWFSTYLILLC